MTADATHWLALRVEQELGALAGCGWRPHRPWLPLALSRRRVKD